MPPKESGLIIELTGALPIADVCNIPDVVTIKGWLGKGPVVDGNQSWRIYLNHSMTAYYEVPAEADILHTVQLGTSVDDPQRIWLRQGTKTRLVTMRSGNAEIVRGPLEGTVAQTYYSPVPAAPQMVFASPGTPGGFPPGWDGGGDGGGWETSQCKNHCYSASP